MTSPRTDILIWLLRSTRENERDAERMTSRTVWSYRRRIEERQQIGFRYRPSDWFGDVPPAEVKRLQREIVAMANEGLLERITGFGGTRMTHLKLTAKGRSEAERMAKGSSVRIIKDDILVKIIDADAPVEEHTIF